MTEDELREQEILGIKIGNALKFMGGIAALAMSIPDEHFELLLLNADALRDANPGKMDPIFLRNAEKLIMEAVPYVKQINQEVGIEEKPIFTFVDVLCYVVSELEGEDRTTFFEYMRYLIPLELPSK